MWSAAFSPKGTRVVTASMDKTARVWDADTGKPISPPLQHQKAVWSAAFSPDGTRVVTASEDKTARVWDGGTGNPLSHQDRVWEVPLASGTLSDWRATMERASPYVLVNGVLSLRTLDGSAGPSTPNPPVQSTPPH